MSSEQGRKQQKNQDLKAGLHRAEEFIEKALHDVTTHPLFLEGVSSMINFNSYRKVALRSGLRKFWKALELPNRVDQEKTLYLITELQFKIQNLERELARAKAANFANPGSSDVLQRLQQKVTAGKEKKTATLQRHQ